MTPYELAYEYAMHTSRCVFLTGKAGTGKTTLLRRLRTECPKQMAIVAPTGVAAINAEGVTIHSLFQLPPQIFLPTDSARRQLFQEMQMRAQKQRVLRNLELLIIDEVSMVRSDLLDAIDAVLRHFKRRHNLPFGGTQVIFIGDLYQLSPVAREEDWRMMQPYYSGPYFFQALVFNQLQPVYIELDHVFRQSNKQFVDVLNQVRNNRLTPEAIALLNSRYQPVKSDSLDVEHLGILLSTHNRKVDTINASEMERLKGKTYTYEAQIRDTFPESMYPMDTTLSLKVGARVMFIKNDSSQEKAYYNGRLAVVDSLGKEEIVVRFEDQSLYTLHRETWENIRYQSNEQSDEIQAEVIGRFSHFPLRLAWAITIHKSQGLTFDRVQIDAEQAFAAGQVYVALSRCRSLEGITLHSRIPEHALYNANEVVNFTSQQPSIQAVEQSLCSAESNYLSSLLGNLYDFRDLIESWFALRTETIKLPSLQGEASEWLIAQSAAIEALQPIGEKFQRQIQQICLASELNENFLTERLKAANQYFVPKLEEASRAIKSCPVTSNISDEAEVFQKAVDEIYVEIKRRIHILNALSKNPSVASIFEARKQFVPTLPNLHIDISVRRKTGNTRTQVSKSQDKLTVGQRKSGKGISPSIFQTLHHFFRGKRTIASLAKERHLSERTILGHLSILVQQGILNAKELNEQDQHRIDSTLHF